MCIRDSLYIKYAKIIRINDSKIENFKSFFSIIFFIVGPKFPIKNAIKKKREPLVTREIIIKYKILKFIKPLVIVSSLKGTGEKPAIAKRVIQAITPPSEDTYFLKMKHHLHHKSQKF